MPSARYIALTVVQCEDVVEAQIRLTDHHNDRSREEVVYPLRIQPVRDAEDLESWTRDVLASAIELI